MPMAAHCSTCGHYVWVTETGCENGHPHPCLRDVREMEALPPKPDKVHKPQPPQDAVGGRVYKGEYTPAESDLLGGAVLIVGEMLEGVLPEG